MSDKTAIEWTDTTWNPVTGCTEVSPGCDHCYAKTFAERWRGVPGHHFQQGFDLVLRPERLDQPIRWTRPRQVFVNSMSDLFHKDVPDDYIAQVFAVMACAHQHTYQVLTKRHGRMRALLSSPDFQALVYAAINARPAAQRADVPGTLPLPNVWLGVSVEDQQRAELRIPALLRTPAAVRFLSCEPLLGPVDLTRWIDDERNALDQAGDIDWVIVGGESGHGARPMHPGWVDSLRDQCVTHGVPFFFKQWGEFQDRSVGPDQRGTDYVVVWDGRHETTAAHWHENDRGLHTSDLARARLRSERGTEHATWIGRVGKKAAGRELDGRTWDQVPAVAS